MFPFVKYILLSQNVGVEPNTKHQSYTHTHTYTRNRREVASRLPSFIYAHTHTPTYRPISIPCLFPTLHHHNHNIQHSIFLFSFALSLLFYFSVALFAFRFLFTRDTFSSSHSPSPTLTPLLPAYLSTFFILKRGNGINHRLRRRLKPDPQHVHSRRAHLSTQLTPSFLHRPSPMPPNRTSQPQRSLPLMVSRQIR